MNGLTAPQQRMLDEVRASGVRIYNGRATRTVKALRAAGLVHAEYDLIPGSTGWSEKWTVRPA